MLRISLLTLAVLFPVAAHADDVQPPFSTWVADYRAKALARGVSAATLDSVLVGLEPDPRVISLDRTQPDTSTPSAPASFASYLARRLDTPRITAGQAAAARVAGPIAGIEARHGVPAAILLGIWGMETSYGRVTGNMSVAQSVATLAWDGRRAELFTKELDAVIEITEKKLATPAQMRGSWAGAMGQPQFLPSSYLTYAIDGDGDGKADIWSSEPDTLASIANYLKVNGWTPGLPWGQAVTLPASLDRAALQNPEKPTTCIRPLSVHTKWMPARDWQALGLTSARPFPAPDTPMTLVEPDGPGQGAWLVTANYRTLMTYNCSNFYALSVALLGDALSTSAR
ncbi:lytic murein transglycosylase [Polymorphobacter sp.]|uniref:lytic murein transglycosylase n=1 Tax=Polymorphobacter sp. TaxID=1909290 RepID=UPI003F700898